MIVSRSHSLRPFLLSLLVVPALASKALHLFQHTHSLSPLLLALYFPTFFVLEILLFVAAWFLLNRTYGAKSVVGAAIVGLLGYVSSFCFSRSAPALTFPGASPSPLPPPRSVFILSLVLKSVGMPPKASAMIRRGGN